MFGDSAFIATTIPAGTPTMKAQYTEGTSEEIIVQTTAGNIYRWTGSAWNTLRTGLSTTSTLWQSWTQFSGYLVSTDPTNGMYKYNGATYIRIGGKSIATMETGEDARWTGTAANTTDYREGLQAREATSNGAQTDMVFTPASAINLNTGLLSAKAYSMGASGTDYFHFLVRITGTGTLDTTNTRLLVTTSAGNTLNFPFTVWRTERSSTGATASATSTSWQEIFCLASQGTQTGTFNATSVTSFTFSVDTSAGSRTMIADDFYVIYATTMSDFQLVANNRNLLWGAQTTANPARIGFSNTNAPDEFDAAAIFTLQLEDGEPVTSMTPFLVTAVSPFVNEIAAGKENSLHSISGLSGTYPSFTFTIQRVSAEVGISSHRGVAQAGNVLVFWYKDQIWGYKGTGVDKLSYPIEPTIAPSVIDQSDLPLFVVAAPHRGRSEIWWTYRRSGQTSNDRVLKFNYQEKAFLPVVGLSTPLLTQVTSSGALRLLSVNSTGVIRRQDDTTSLAFSGTNITSNVELPVMGDPDQASSWLEVEIEPLSNTGDIDLSYRIGENSREIDGASYASIATITQNAAGEAGRHFIGDRGNLVQLRVQGVGVRWQLPSPIIVDSVPLGMKM